MIDDMGLARAQSERAVRLPGPITLSWMPYAPNVTEQAAAGAAHGHETMLHMNMEALGRTDPGPNSLTTWQPPETNLAYLRHGPRPAARGGRAQPARGQRRLAVGAADGHRDGRTEGAGTAVRRQPDHPHSVALARAEAAGIAAAPRDVFLDNSPDPHAIRAQIAAMEGIARRNGHVIAIGHPRPTTMDALAAYLPTAAARGFVLWPVSATVAAQRAKPGRPGRSAPWNPDRAPIPGITERRNTA